jgi:hypothetical protein
MSCAECERAEPNQRGSRIKRWLGLAFVALVVAFIAHEQLSVQAPAQPQTQKPSN